MGGLMLVVIFVTNVVNMFEWPFLSTNINLTQFVFLDPNYPREKELIDAVKSKEIGTIKDLIKITDAEAKDISHDVPFDKSHWTPLIYAGNIPNFNKSRNEKKVWRGSDCITGFHATLFFSLMNALPYVDLDQGIQ